MESKIRFRKYEKGDLWYLMNKDFVKEVWGNSPEPQNTDIAFTMVDQYDNVLGCAGFSLMWIGVYDTWLQGKSYEIIYKNKITIVKYIKNQINNLTFNRIQSTCLKDSKNYKFLEFLGFSCEGTLHKYGPDGQDYLMYSLVK